MKAFFFIWGIVSLFSCEQLLHCTDNEFSQKNNDSEHTTKAIKTDTTQQNLSKSIEKVVIEYWDNYYANNFIFEILGDNKGTEIIYGGETLFTEKKTLREVVTRNRLVSYINHFYIDKEEEIELKRTKRDYIESTDYPYIKVIGYQRGKEVFNKRTQIGEEQYDVKYNPLFLEFYEFLEVLVKKE